MSLVAQTYIYGPETPVEEVEASLQNLVLGPLK
jgi:hypothetical protein